MIDSLPERPMLMAEVENIDGTSDGIFVSAVSILTPDSGEHAVGGKFEVYTIMVEDDGARYLVGFDEEADGWTKFWEGTTEDAYEPASEQWMHENYGDQITQEERLDASDTR